MGTRDPGRPGHAVHSWSSARGLESVWIHHTAKDKGFSGALCTGGSLLHWAEGRHAGPQNSIVALTNWFAQRTMPCPSQPLFQDASQGRFLGTSSGTPVTHCLSGSFVGSRAGQAVVHCNASFAWRRVQTNLVAFRGHGFRQPPRSGDELQGALDPERAKLDATQRTIAAGNAHADALAKAGAQDDSCQAMHEKAVDLIMAILDCIGPTTTTNMTNTHEHHDNQQQPSTDDDEKKEAKKTTKKKIRRRRRPRR